MYALVRTPEKDVYQVRQGNYLGQNYGVVIGVTDGEIRLKELVQDGAGDWTERSSTLQLLQPDSCSKSTGSEENERVRPAQHRQGSAGERPAARPRGSPARSRSPCTGAAFAQGTNSIDSMTVSKGSSGNTIVRFTLKAPPANPPAGFAIASPPRIALDFLDTGNGLGSDAADARRRRGAQPQRGAGGQPHARRVQSEQAADVRDAGRGQRRAW